MLLPTVAPSLAALRPDYDALLCDIWGVVHNGVAAFQPAVNALLEWRNSGGRVVLISNVPKPAGPIPGQLERLGVPPDAWDAIATAGDATRAEILARVPGPMYLIGPEHDAPLWEGTGVERADLDEASFVLATGLDDFWNGKPEDHRGELERARERGLELLCANPDVVVRHGDNLHWCAGALARDYEALGGVALLSGKPHAPIYRLALERLARAHGAEVPRSRVLAIGDGPATDARGANREGLDLLFVTGGINDTDLFDDDAVDPSAAAEALEREGAHARFVSAALA